MTPAPAIVHLSRLDLRALAISPAAALAVLFVVCWAAAAVFLGWLSAAHRWIALFSSAPVDSARALGEGILWSVVLGWTIAVVLVPIYNGLASTARS